MIAAWIQRGVSWLVLCVLIMHNPASMPCNDNHIGICGESNSAVGYADAAGYSLLDSLFLRRRRTEGDDADDKKDDVKALNGTNKNGEDSSTKDNSDAPSGAKVRASQFTVYNSRWNPDAKLSFFILGSDFTETMKIRFKPELDAANVKIAYVSDQMLSVTLVGNSFLDAEKFFKDDANKVEVEVSQLIDVGKVTLVKPTVEAATIVRLPRVTIPEKPQEISSHEKSIVVKGEFFDKKATSFTFSPELKEGTDYDITALTKSKAVLSLMPGRSWPANLELLTIDVGAGKIPINLVSDQKTKYTFKVTESEYPVTINALPEDDLPRIYRQPSANSRSFKIRGGEFQAGDKITLTLRVAPETAKSVSDSKILVQGTDFDTKIVNKTTLEISLLENDGIAAWAPVSIFPNDPDVEVYLTVTKLRSESAGGADDRELHPIPIAVLIEAPSVKADMKTLLYQTMSRTLHIKGNGFVAGETKLFTRPPLVQDEDFTVHVSSSVALEMKLLPGKKWRKTEGELAVTGIDIGAGKVHINSGKGVRVAIVEEDFDGKIKLDMTREREYVYQTLGPYVLRVNTTEFPIAADDGDDKDKKPKKEPVIKVQLGPQLSNPPGSDDLIASFDVSAAGEERLAGALVIKFKPDATTKKWLDTPGPLLLVSMTIDGKVYKMGDNTQLVDVLPDPSVIATPEQKIHNGYSTFFDISGDGFRFDMQDDFNALVNPSLEKRHFIFDPPLVQNEDYVLWVQNKSGINMELIRTEGPKSWMKGDKKNYRGPLKILKVNTGAGLVDVDKVVGQIVDDPEGLICSNTCEFASDGSCDEYERPGSIFHEPDCKWGTDCNDCGPRLPMDHEMQKSNKGNNKNRCDDSCGKLYVNDDTCDDGRPGSWFKFCELGTDCSDCGPIPEEGFGDESMCSSGRGGSTEAEMQPGIPCVFPFTYKGVEYIDSCAPGSGPVFGNGGGVPTSDDNWGWCALTSDLETDRKWASCIHCVTVLGSELADEYEIGSAAEEYEEAESSKKSKGGKRGSGGESPFAKLLTGLLVLVIIRIALYIIEKAGCCPTVFARLGMQSRSAAYIPVAQVHDAEEYDTMLERSRNASSKKR